MAKILVIDDEPEIGRFVHRVLESDGHQVEVITDGADGLRRALTSPPGLVVLDLLMPGVDGQAVLGGILAQHPNQKVLVLSAAADVHTRVDCLERGAVDFLAKPFSVRELTARVRTRLRDPVTRDDQDVLRAGPLVLDMRRRELTVDGRPTELPHRELILLAYLMRRAGQVCSRQELLSELWGYDFDPGTNVVDACVARLRRRLPNDLVQTVRHVGYKLQTP